jgi:hypothetical protein
VHGRDEHRGVGRCGSGDLGDIAGLHPEVEFLGEGVGEAAAEVADVVGACPLGLGLKTTDKAADSLQVAGDLFVDAGSLHFEVTAEPSVRQPACACASEALATGSGSTWLKTSPILVPSSSSSSASTCGHGAGDTWSCSSPWPPSSHRRFACSSASG